MKKIIGLMLSLVAIFALSTQTFAATVNDVMTELKSGIQVGNEVVQVPNEYIKLAQDFFDSNDLTAEELDFALSELKAVKSIWASTGKTSFGQIPADIRQQLIDRAVSAAAKVGATLTVDGKTIKVVDKNGKVYTVNGISDPIKTTGFGIDTNGMVAVSAIVVVALASSVVLARKNKLFGAK